MWFSCVGEAVCHVFKRGARVHCLEMGSLHWGLAGVVSLRVRHRDCAVRGTVARARSGCDTHYSFLSGREAIQ